MKKIIIILVFTFISLVSNGQMKFMHDTLSPVIVKQEYREINLHLQPLKKDNGPKVTATVFYLGLNGIISINQFTSPPNVQKELMPAYVGTLVLTTVAYTIFLIIN